MTAYCPVYYVPRRRDASDILSANFGSTLPDDVGDTLFVDFSDRPASSCAVSAVGKSYRLLEYPDKRVVKFTAFSNWDEIEFIGAGKKHLIGYARYDDVGAADMRNGGKYLEVCKKLQHEEVSLWADKVVGLLLFHNLLSKKRKS